MKSNYVRIKNKQCTSIINVSEISNIYFEYESINNVFGHYNPPYIKYYYKNNPKCFEIYFDDNKACKSAYKQILDILGFEI